MGFDEVVECGESGRMGLRGEWGGIVGIGWKQFGCIEFLWFFVYFLLQ